ncbi:MAG: protein-L-isoaspartate O-methyltransferase [Alphaproteobacteria bacterium]|nr:protein-L-isoaspartate O-methyltransferase [Alphaproteobacteria bacterium]MBV9372793.1 protein-L-isoaspartate O-methyltransferase [Alphaproteobacteria bacterium]MBV9900512.1 protein-L-isoaspartate O-methyltransferase [Alphaproteobacteria bacterium]
MSKHDFEHMRRAMVASQLRTTGTNDPRVLAAMGEVPRERFVPEGRVAVAYADALVPLTPERDLNSPMALGRLLTEAAPQPGERAMVIGAATGYAAAVLARLVGNVVAVEEDAQLAAAARKALEGSGVTVVEGPMAAGWPAAAPYDLILIDGAVEFVPQPLIDQLAAQGRLAAAILENGVTRLALGRKAGEGFGMAAFADAAAAVLPGFVKPRAFVF